MNLEQLCKHPSFPFADFRNNDLEFLLLEMFWIENFRAIFENAEQVESWMPLFPAERDGVPILVMANLRTRRAFRVDVRINEEKRPLYVEDTPDAPEKYFLPFDLWLTDVIDSTGDVTYQGLVVSADMSPSARDLAQQVMTKFCRDKASKEDIQRWIKTYYDDLREHGYHWA